MSSTIAKEPRLASISVPYNFKHCLHVDEELAWNGFAGKDAFSAFQLVEKLGEGYVCSLSFLFLFSFIFLFFLLFLFLSPFSLYSDSYPYVRAYGQVYKAIASTGYTIVVKILNIDMEEEQSLCKEIEILRTIRHPNIVPYYGTVTDSESSVVWVCLFLFFMFFFFCLFFLYSCSFFFSALTC